MFRKWMQIANDLRELRGPGKKDAAIGARAAKRLHESAKTHPRTTRCVLRWSLEKALPWQKPDGKFVKSMKNAHMPRPDRVLVPRTRAELREMMVRAATKGLRMRGAGGEYSFSNVAFTDGYFLRLGPRFNKMVDVELDVLNTTGKSMQGALASFEGGATIGQINRYLTKKGKALEQQPAFGGLSYVGSMTVGGHGSGVAQGPIADYVRSLRLFTVDAQGQVVDLRIEPASKPITDPAEWSKRHPDVKLIQDDELFWSCVVCAGCFGVIHEVTIETQKAFFLKEDRKMVPWDVASKEVDDLVRNASSHPELHNVSLFVNPYGVNGSPQCILAKYPYANASEVSQVGSKRGIGMMFGGMAPIPEIVGLIARVDPATIPSLIDGALWATEGLAVLPSTVALDQASPNYIPVHASASGVGVDRWIQATEDVMKLLKDRAEKKGHYVESPMGLRFVKASSAYLAPSYGRPTCMIETPCLRGTPEALETLGEIHAMLARDHDGRPHWGQVMQGGPDVLRDDKGNFRFPAFLASFAKLNPRGFFNNAFTKQVRL